MSNPVNPDQDKSVFDKAKDMASGLRDKVGDFFDGDEEKTDSAIEQAGEQTADRFRDEDLPQ